VVTTDYTVVGDNNTERQAVLSFLHFLIFCL